MTRTKTLTNSWRVELRPGQLIRLIVESPDGGRAEVIGTLADVPDPGTLVVKGRARQLPPEEGISLGSN